MRIQMKKMVRELLIQKDYDLIDIVSNEYLFNFLKYCYLNLEEEDMDQIGDKIYTCKVF